jgi:hypothetical protein
VRTFVVPYASRVENGLPCPDARARCDKAVRVAREVGGKIVIGVGSSSSGDANLFVDAMVRFFRLRCWPKEFLIVADPGGFGTLGESRAAYNAIREHGDGKIVVVSAWYHVPRIWLIWASFGKIVSVRVSWETYPWTNPLREFVLLPLTLAKILWVRLPKTRVPTAPSVATARPAGRASRSLR